MPQSKRSKAFGPDAAPALPTFIEMLADHSLSYRARVITIVAAIGPKAKETLPMIVKHTKAVRDSNDYVYPYYSEGLDAIVAISPTPKDAAADLASFLGNHDWNYSAFTTICKIGPDAKEAIPALRQYILNEVAEKKNDPSKNLVELRGLANLGSDVVPLLVELLDTDFTRKDALACLEKLGPKAIKAAPALMKLLKFDDPEMQYQVATLLWKLEKNQAAITTLAELLKRDPVVTPENFPQSTVPGTIPGEKSNLALNAAKMLGEIGPDAKEALPALREAILTGLPASVLSGIYAGLATHKVGDQEYIISGSKCYDLYRHYAAIVAVSEAATEAIAKIEQKPKK